MRPWYKSSSSRAVTFLAGIEPWAGLMRLSISRRYSRRVVGERPSLVICLSHPVSNWSTVKPAPGVLPLRLPSSSLTSFASALSAVVISGSSAAYPGQVRDV